MGKRGPAPKLYSYKGNQYSMNGLADMAGIGRSAMYQRIHAYGYSVAEAVEAGKVASGSLAYRHTYAGHTLTLRQWSERVGIPRMTLAGRLYRGWTIEQALCIPNGEQRRRGVVFNFPPFEGTGAGSFPQEIPEITFSEQAENA